MSRVHGDDETATFDNIVDLAVIALLATIVIINAMVLLLLA